MSIDAVELSVIYFTICPFRAFSRCLYIHGHSQPNRQQNKTSKFRGVLSKMMFTDLTPIRRYTVEAVEVPAANYILALSSFTL